MTLAALAAAAGLAAWLNAKYHIVNDLGVLKILHQSEKHVAQRAKEQKSSVWYSFEDVVHSSRPYQEAIWSREGNFTFTETWNYACRYAQFLGSLGITTRDPVCFFLTNSPDMVFAWLGSWCAGGFPALVNYNLTGASLVHCLKSTNSKVVFVDEESEIRARIEDIRETVEKELGMIIIVIDDAFRKKVRSISTQRPSDDRRTGLTYADTCMLLFTSGTTGFPKAVTISHGRFMLSSKARYTRLEAFHNPDARFYVCMPMYHGTGGIIGMMCMSEGLCLCIGKRFSSRTFWNDIHDSGAQSFVYVGETLRYLLAAPPSAKDKENKIKLIFGNGLRPDVWRAFQERFGIDTIGEFFSSTEGVFELFNQSRGEFSATAVGHHGLLFRALGARRIGCARISDENTKDLYRDPRTGLCQSMPLSVGGEILVKVPGISPAESGFAGYHKNDKATNEKFVADVFQKGDLYYRTGDALRRNNDGLWYFLDRLGDTFRWKSENVSTAEVAEVVGTFPGILEANVYGVLVPGHDGRAGCAAVYIPGSSQSATRFDWKGLSQHIRSKLPRYAMPAFVRVLNGEIRAGMHNMKQNKVILRSEGCDIDKIESSGDKMYYLPQGQDVYQEYKGEHWLGFNERGLKL